MSDDPPDPWLLVETLGAAGEGTPLDTIPSRISTQIEGLIAAGRLKSGAPLPSARQLARMFGVSRPSVREAVHRLEALGLVTVRPGTGVFVAARPALAEPTAEAPLPPVVEIEELFEVRRLFEPAAAEWAARRTAPSGVALLQRLTDRFELEAAASEPSMERLAEADIRFHLQLAECAGNAVLARLVERLHDLYRLQLEWSLRRPGRIDETISEHRRVVDAIAARDGTRARTAMLEHLAAAETYTWAVSGGSTVPSD